MLKSEKGIRTTRLGFPTSNFTIHTSSILALDLVPVNSQRFARKFQTVLPPKVERRSAVAARNSATTQFNASPSRNRTHEPSISRRRSVVLRCSLLQKATSQNSNCDAEDRRRTDSHQNAQNPSLPTNLTLCPRAPPCEIPRRHNTAVQPVAVEDVSICKDD